MIKLIETNKMTVETITPYYTLIYNYSIGNSCGYTTKEVYLSVDNPYIERYCTLLNSIQPLRGRWGIILNEETIESCFKKENQITEDDYNFLMRTMFSEENNYFKTDEENNYADEFYEGVIEELGYDFLVFEDVKLIYTDEHNVIFDTKFVNYGL